MLKKISYILFFHFQKYKLKRYVRLLALFILYVLPAGYFHVCTPLLHSISLWQYRVKKRRQKNVRSLQKLLIVSSICYAFYFWLFSYLSFSLLSLVSLLFFHFWFSHSVARFLILLEIYFFGCVFFMLLMLLLPPPSIFCLSYYLFLFSLYSKQLSCCCTIFFLFLWYSYHLK